MTARTQIGRAIVLSAGKGSRLLPLTAERPKCLIEMSGRTLLEWQLDSLFAAGIREIAVVAGFGLELVEEVLARRGPRRGSVSIVFNPFYHVADNLGSAWMARSAMDRDFLLLNGDTLVPPALIEGLLAAAPAPITLAVDTKEQYDSDDMKVLCEGDRLVRVDKKLPAGSYNAEAIGLARFIGAGRTAFCETVEQMMRTPEGTSQFYLRAIDRLADTGVVHAARIGGLEWVEVDYPADLEMARRLTSRWAGANLPGGGPVQAEPFA
ncbi:MAG: L-glutamine-phosphate cytidylyltransferase [Sphingomonadales bacterium]|jgi:choline kinase|nr:L-glutamine-phosphate cytidylyltransferase [Sphingomonadales bacterium]